MWARARIHGETPRASRRGMDLPRMNWISSGLSQYLARKFRKV